MPKKLAADLPSLQEIKTEKARREVMSFAQYASMGTWVEYPHLCRLNEKLMAVFRGNIKRLAVFMPPRHGKSEFVSKYFPVFWLGRRPKDKVILASYEANFAASWGRKAREVMEEWGRPLFGVKVSQQSRATNWWETTQGGGMITAGVLGPITGKGANLLIIDDPIKNYQEAMSSTYRDNLWEWFRSTAYTRLEPGGAVVLAMARWTADDLAGRILRKSKERWTVVKFPAIATQDEPEIGRKIDDPLWPDRFPLEALKDARMEAGPYWWASLFQQAPDEKMGKIFVLSWFKRYNELPAFNYIIQSWDTAFKESDKASYTVGETWGRTRNAYYLIDVFRGKLEYPELKEEIKRAYRKHEPNLILVEDKASGQSVTQELQRDTHLPLLAVPVPPGDKELRASMVAPMVEVGRVFLPEQAEWLPAFEQEIIDFPNTEFKDQVDSMVQVLYHFKSKESEKAEVKTFGKRRFASVGRGTF